MKHDTSAAAAAKLRITEIFASVQGESTRVGLPTVFVRLTGCPLRCTWCDTAYAFTGGESRTLEAVMDEIAIMVILGPMLISIAKQFGVDPIHFGAMIVTNVAIGMAAPPIGYCLFVGMAIGGTKLWPLSRAILPFVFVMLLVLIAVTYVPTFALALVP